ncbi:uncharacterized protein IAS62_003630 [Cryptococcus decagattii]|uniref:Uncharacterized protein n=1 Tax=Cryptococcus decagattii TaxID=1859122 RepID=A0ABZ2AUT7_9TREE
MLPNTRSQRRAVLSERFGILYQSLPSEVKAIAHWHIKGTGSKSTLFTLIQTCKSLYEEFLPSLCKEVVLNKLNASAFYHGLIDESPVGDRLLTPSKSTATLLQVLNGWLALDVKSSPSISSVQSTGA